VGAAGAGPGRRRIGVTGVARSGAPADADSLRALAEAAKLCAELGHRVEEADPQIDAAAVVPAFLTLASANTVVNLASHPTKGRPPLPGEVENVTYATGQLGEKVTAADYIRGRRPRTASAGKWRRFTRPVTSSSRRRSQRCRRSSGG